MTIDESNCKLDRAKADGIELAPQPVNAARSIWWWILVVVMPLGIADFAVVPLMEKIRPHDGASVFVYTCFGLIPAQAALLTVGLVFGEGPLWRRLLIHWGCSLLLIIVWFVGFASTSNYTFPDRDWQEALRGVCALPIISLAIQTPHWTIRCFFGWRFVYRDPAHSFDESPSVEANLTIRDLLMATAVIALSLAISRLAPLPEHLQANPQTFWLAVAAFAGSAAGVSAIGVLPLLAIFFSKLSLGLAWFFGITYALSYGVLLLIFAASGILGMPVFETPQVIGTAAVLMAFAGGTAAGLTLLRKNRVTFVRS